MRHSTQKQFELLPIRLCISRVPCGISEVCKKVAGRGRTLQLLFSRETAVRGPQPITTKGRMYVWIFALEALSSGSPELAGTMDIRAREESRLVLSV